MAEKKEKKFIQSIGRATTILQYIADNGNSARLVDMSNDLGLNKSTLHSIISTLQQLGYVSQDEETSKYSLGIKLFELGKTYEKDMSIKKIVRPFLEKLVEEFQETAHLAVESQLQVLFIDRVEPSHSLRTITNIGEKDYMYYTAVGKVLLAAANKEKQESIIEKSGLKTFTDKTITDAVTLKQELSQVKLKGYAYDREEKELGVNSVAVPIKNHKGKTVGAISLSGPTSRVSEEKLNKMRDRLLEVSMEISNALGYK